MMKLIINLLRTLSCKAFCVVAFIVIFATNANASSLIGYWQNWNASASPYIQLNQIDNNYNVIEVSFASPVSTTDMTMTFVPEQVSQATFITQVQALQSQGKRVLISIGGQNSVIDLANQQRKTEFVTSMTNIINTFGFDGIDIDIENGNSILISGGTIANPTNVSMINLIEAIREIMQNYRISNNSKMMLTMAPETAYIQGGQSGFGSIWGGYLPIVHALRDSIDILQVQLYNSGSMYGLDGGIYSQGTADFIIAMTEAVIQGFNTQGGSFLGLPANKVAIALPSCSSAAGGGFTDTAIVASAVRYLKGSGARPGTYILRNPNGYPNLCGLMTWSINWDATANCGGVYSFAQNYSRLFPTPPVAPNLIYPVNQAIDLSLNPTLSWATVSNASSYRIQLSNNVSFSNPIVNQTTSQSNITVSNLPSSALYYWRVKAIASGDSSAWSEVRSFSTVSSDVTQNILLTEGWNLISGYLTPTNPAISNITSGIATQFKLMKNSQGQTFWPPFINSLNTWNTQQAYMTNVSASCTLSISGQQIVPDQTPILFANSGWYWLAYFRTANQAPVTALAGISGNYSLVKSVSGQTYWPPFMNSLANLEPSKGYMIYITNPTTLTYPANATQASGKIDATMQAEPKYLLSDYSGTGNSATLAIEIDGAKSGDEFGVFTADGLLVGSAVYSGKATGVNIWGDNDITTQKDGASENEELFVKLYNAKANSSTTLAIGSITNMLNNEKVTCLQYKANGIYLATAKAEVSAVNESYADFSISPQPVRNEAVVTYSVVPAKSVFGFSEANAGIYIELYDLKGALVAAYYFTSLNEGTNKLRLDVSNLVSGMYNVIIKSGTEVHQSKMIKVD